MKTQSLYLTLSRAALALPALLFALTVPARAVTFTLVSAGPPTWTYNLTFLPEDNCDIDTSPTTITMTGLTGVTGAGGPTSTDFPAGSLTTNNLNWTPTFTSTSVTWTNPTCGSGNFAVAKTVFGFTITAPTAPNGSASFATHGFQVDGHGAVVDAAGSIAGPSTAAPAHAPVLSPTALLITMIGLGCVGAYETKRRLQGWFGNNANQA